MERNTRYNEKVKSGQIASYVPEWQRKEFEKDKRQQAKEFEREKKEAQRREKQIEREEKLFKVALKKIERQLKYEESIRIKRAERQSRYGFYKWELQFQDQPQHRYSLRHKDTSE